MDNLILQEILEWWEKMPSELKDKFPEPQSDFDIVEYYENQEAYMEIDYSLKLI